MYVVHHTECHVFLLSDPDDVRVIFGTDPLEDDRTLAYYRMKHLSVLIIVMKMPGGGGKTFLFA